MTTTRSIKFLGCNDEQLSCDCCGRTDLKKTVVLDIDGEVVRYGTSCAANAIGWDAKDVRSEAKEAQDEINRQAWIVSETKARAESDRWTAWLNSKVQAPSVIEQLQALGGYGVARQMYREEVCNV